MDKKIIESDLELLWNGLESAWNMASKNALKIAHSCSEMAL